MTVQANAQGVVTGKFRIPDNIPPGTKSVRFIGAGGSYGTATFVGEGFDIIEERQMVTTQNITLSPAQQIIPRRVDPLAETFMPDANTQITAVQLFVVTKGSTPIDVQIREVDNGVPTDVILAQARLLPSQITANQWNTWTFPRPQLLLAGQEYALVVLCNDAVAEVGVAELGKFDQWQKRWVTTQPYNVGVLLSSSNASTWTPHQTLDLTFRLRHSVYTTTKRTVRVGTFSASSVTDLMVRATVETPSSACSVVFILTLPGGTTRRVSAEQPISLDTAITGTITVDAELTGTANMTPILHRDVQLVYGSIRSTSDYVGRAILGGTNVTTKIIVEALLPGSSTVQAFIKGVDKDDTKWTSLTDVTSQNMDEGWVELTFTSENMSEDMIHAKLVLSGSSKYRPRCRNLRMLVI